MFPLILFFVAITVTDTFCFLSLSLIDKFLEGIVVFVMIEVIPVIKSDPEEIGSSKEMLVNCL